MIVRNDQISALEIGPDRDFHRRAFRYVQLRYPGFQDALGDEPLRQMVTRGIARARTHGLTWESALVRFLELMFSLAPNFDELPAIRSKMRDESLPPEERLNVVIDKTTYEEWQAVCRNYDPMAWGVDPVLAPEVLHLRGEARL